MATAESSTSVVPSSTGTAAPSLGGGAAPVTGGSTIRAAIVSLGGELFAVDLQNVREVFVVESITPVPGIPSGLVGSMGKGCSGSG